MTPERYQLLSELFSRACRLEGTAREGFLRNACDDDPSIRSELEDLLDRDAKLAGFLETESVSPPPLPDSIGHHRIVASLGEGGMGIVYLAEQTEPVARKVALKVIRGGLYSREVALRFSAERQALACLHHPNIARLLDAGQTPDGRPYFSMEYVHGETITAYCDRHRLGLHERLKLFLQVCRAVNHAHGHGIIHRDLKPSNILVALADGEPLVKVIDFGIAKAIGHRLTVETLHTRFPLGTWEYMSPEQAGGDTAGLDHRSDIYALGVVLYELLVGVLPFAWDAKTPLSEIIRTSSEKDPPRPSQRWTRLARHTAENLARNRTSSVARVTAMLHGGLDTIVTKALERKREHRYGSAAALMEDIQNRLAGRSPRSAGLLWHVRRTLVGHRVAVGMTLLLLCAVLVGVSSGWFLWESRYSPPRSERLEYADSFYSLGTSMTVLTGGDVVISFQALKPNLPSHAATDCFARIYSSRGFSERFRLSPEEPEGKSNLWEFGPVTACVTNGSFVTAWGGGHASGNDVHVLRFDKVLQPIGNDTILEGFQSWPSIASWPDGRFIVVGALEIAPFTVFGRLFRENGQHGDAPFQVNVDAIRRRVLSPLVCMAPNGSFAVVYPGGQACENVLVRLFDAHASPRGAEFKANLTSRAREQCVSAGFTSTNQLVVAWAGEGEQDPWGILARVFPEDGVSPAKGEFSVNEVMYDKQTVVNLSVGPRDELLFAWTGFDGDNSTGVLACIRSPSGEVYTPEFKVNQYFKGEQFTTYWGGARGLAMTEDTLLFSWAGDGPQGIGVYVTAFAYARTDSNGRQVVVGDVIEESLISEKAW